MLRLVSNVTLPDHLIQLPLKPAIPILLARPTSRFTFTFAYRASKSRDNDAVLTSKTQMASTRSPESARFADYSVQALLFNILTALPSVPRVVDRRLLHAHEIQKSSFHEQVLSAGSVTLLPKTRGPSIESDGEC